MKDCARTYALDLEKFYLNRANNLEVRIVRMPLDVEVVRNKGYKAGGLYPQPSRSVPNRSLRCGIQAGFGAPYFTLAHFLSS